MTSRMSTEKTASVLALTTQDQDEEQNEEQETADRRLYLAHGRSLAVTEQGSEQLLELRAASGALELRIKLTEEGPVLQVEGMKVAVTAAESIDLACKNLTVAASESVAIAAGGAMKLSTEAELELEAKADVKVVGECIYLN
jgi:hypothetical protein